MLSELVRGSSSKRKGKFATRWLGFALSLLEIHYANSSASSHTSHSGGWGGGRGHSQNK